MGGKAVVATHYKSPTIKCSSSVALLRNARDIMQNIRFQCVAPAGRIRVKSSRLWRECRGEACLARHVRRTRIADIAIIHFKTSFVGYRGRGMTHIYRSLAQGYRRDFTALTGRIRS